MPRKKTKKGMVSTKRFIQPPEIVDIEPTSREIVEFDEPDPKPAALPTIDEAIAEFRKNPRMETFFCPGRAVGIAHGNKYIKFEWDFRRNSGVYMTSDPQEVEIIMRSTESGIRYNVAIFAENPAIRNIKIR